MLVSRGSQALCHSCRTELSNLLRYGFAEQRSALRSSTTRLGLLSQADTPRQRQSLNARSLRTTRRLRDVDPNTQEGHRPRIEADVQGVPVLHTSDLVAEARKSGLDIEGIARIARQTHGEYLPPDLLSEKEYARYIRLYGHPRESNEQVALEETQVGGSRPNQLLRITEEGVLEPVEFQLLDEDPELDQDPAAWEVVDGTVEGAKLVNEDHNEDLESSALPAQELAQQSEAEAVLFDEEGNQIERDELAGRTHPLTLEGRFSAATKTIFLPRENFTDPVGQILAPYANKHIDDAASRLLGGPGLPAGVATPIAKRAEQTPIGLTASQHNMTQMEANVFISSLWPGVYASVLSVLVEVRKRLGTDWLRKLADKENGPKILDASSGGAAVIAWREIIKAEWQALYPDQPEAAAPLGQATVLTGSDALRHRAANLLENTTFVPRLPDYVHVRDAPTMDDDRVPLRRKQFDIILAPHALWHLQEEFLRKQYVQNLWSLLSSQGGVLVLLEKGVQRGFEVVAGARQMILERLVSSPGSEEFEDTTQARGDGRFITKGAGMIIAPCTNHEQCPMYTTPGVSSGRKDFCAFEQRYIRPPYLQRILKAKSRNHEDISYSYIAVRKGIDTRPMQGTEANQAAFQGYERFQQGQEVDMLSLPRIVYPPLRRRGHVIMDVCAPPGQIERWTIPKSFSKQAYRDARKSSWGDLWALGAKTSILRNIRLGKKKGPQSKEQRLQAQREEKQEMREEQALEQALQADSPRGLEHILDAEKKELDAIADEEAIDEDVEEDDDVDDEDVSFPDDNQLRDMLEETMASVKPGSSEAQSSPNSGGTASSSQGLSSKPIRLRSSKSGSRADGLQRPRVQIPRATRASVRRNPSQRSRR